MKWTEHQLGDLLKVKHGYAFKSQYFADSGEWIVVTPGSFFEAGGFRERGEKAKFYQGPVPESFILAKGDLIIAMTEQAEGLLGSAALVPESDRYLHNQRIGLISVIDPKKADLRFLYRLFNTYEVRHQISASASGTKVRHTAPERIYRVVVRLPDLPSQRRIADVLSAYDELIETNRRRMGLLEEAARVLYREWFVRLRHPACAKATARQPGHPRTGLPSGWQRKPLSALSGFLNRGIAPHYDDSAEGLVLNQKCIRNQQLDLGPARHQSREVPDGKRVRRHDILINSTGEGTLGRVAQVHTEIPNCTVDSHVTIVRPSEEIGPHYLGLAVMAFEPMLMTAGRGATNQTELARDTIGELSILVPDRETVRRFEEHAEPIFTQVLTLQNQNRQLRAARDLLLPKLMSGRIEV